MAKVGNEARLILSLAEERVKRELDKRSDWAWKSIHSEDWLNGWTAGVEAGIETYQIALHDVVSELEGR